MIQKRYRDRSKDDGWRITSDSLHLFNRLRAAGHSPTDANRMLRLIQIGLYTVRGSSILDRHGAEYARLPHIEPPPRIETSEVKCDRTRVFLG